MQNKTPTLGKDTIVYQILLFASGLLAYIIDDPWMINVIGSNMDIFMMASSAIAIGLSFTKPRIPKENLEILEVTDYEN